MRSVATQAYSPPSGYRMLEIPKPELQGPKDVIIKVHAGSINPIDVKFPSPIGFDCAGTVTEVGPEVTRCKIGDEVYSRLPGSCRGSWSEYARCPEECLALKPFSLSFEDSASIPLAALTALQALRRYDGDLEGRTVFIPAGLSGTGSYACQLAKNVFKAGKVITTVSTAKVPKVPELLGEKVVDEIIDYRKTNPLTTIPAKSVDFIFDTVGQAMEFLPLMRPDGYIISIATLPSGNDMQNWDLLHVPHKPTIPIYVRIPLNLMDAYRRRKARRYGVQYEYLLLEPNGKDLDFLTEFVEDGRLTPVVGTVVKFDDIEAVRKACQVVYDGQGGIGKAVISMGGADA
ncbi:hypothetical protein N8T08_004402 [Aspergillus melleus]|uniref:Uncharacterized protein n=1 Tax=Aspergillus melleus TaxID=138277 RepID=A0ACC3B4T7_9EURO|nr:hypothetical protein N8T08_004402 [Aspergillus melleus]